MIKEIDIRDRKAAEEVLSVQIPSYKVEAELIECSDIPPLKDTVDTLQKCGETFFGYYLNEALCGAISLKEENNTIDIHRLIVQPDHFRKGIAQKLLEFIESKEGIKSLIVSTGSKNTPAINFYEKNGFKKVNQIRVNEHLSLTSFEKKIK
ncbi:GNAT family N-acetyltransferase [Aeromicrobium ponti]|uniref:Acetyltransferase (GNAT) family protein n=1 Tax=Cytobacillus oceanisediminis TaxID=665099 RepID=A0A562K6Y6_9BACI|nr:GNAT family N-acetyltransferase [Cytobacillus oceanisediminis]TWH91182.1 acetyltransferase (GNAT) family protein [Cytobacillus oceanisediminis]